uniref:Uncharacterized protein n=1 Tax=Romanomermis culicivorax TaxID=13658 RepID=A0A915LAZ3_ROMCU
MKHQMYGFGGKNDDYAFWLFAAPVATSVQAWAHKLNLKHQMYGFKKKNDDCALCTSSNSAREE